MGTLLIHKCTIRSFTDVIGECGETVMQGVDPRVQEKVGQLGDSRKRYLIGGEAADVVAAFFASVRYTCPTS